MTSRVRASRDLQGTIDRHDKGSLGLLPDLDAFQRSNGMLVAGVSCKDPVALMMSLPSMLFTSDVQAVLVIPLLRYVLERLAFSLYACIPGFNKRKYSIREYVVMSAV